MTKNIKKHLAMDQPVVYRIRVPGYLDKSWCEWLGGMRVETENDKTDWPITTMAGTVDQAALLSLLRQLYSLGLPLISVQCEDF
jgi:hypothetical protein